MKYNKSYKNCNGTDFETAFVSLVDYFDKKNKYNQWTESDLKEFAKHFFELGLKAQKGE